MSFTGTKWGPRTLVDDLIPKAKLNNVADLSWRNGLDGNTANRISVPAGGALYFEVWFSTSSGIAIPATGTRRIDLYLLPADADGNVPDPPGTADVAIPQGFYLGQIPAINSTTFNRNVSEVFCLRSAGDYFVGAQFNLGVATPATDLNRMYGYTWQDGQG